MKKLCIGKPQKILIGVYFFLSSLFLVLLSLNSHLIINTATEATLQIASNEEIIQTFFPLRNNVKSIIFRSDHSGIPVSIKISGGSGEVYFDGTITTEEGKTVIPLSQVMKNSKSKEYRLHFSSAESISLYLSEDGAYKDNHLLVDGVELTNDIALEEEYGLDFSTILVFSLLGIALILVCLRPETPIKRPPNMIDVLRAIGTLLVLFCHVLSAYFPIFQQQYSIVAAQMGWVGVVIFLLCSSILVWQNYDRYPNVWKFYFHQIGKVYTLYIVMIGLFILFTKITSYQLPLDSSGLYWLRYIFCLNTTVPTTQNVWVNLCATWTIPAFMLFYLLMPLYKKMIRNFWTASFVFVINVVIHLWISYGYSQYVFGQGWDMAVAVQNPWFVQYIFSLGIMLHTAIQEKKVHRLCFVILALCIGCFFELRTSDIYQDITVLVVALVIVMQFTQEKAPILGLSGKLFYRLNEYGFSIYLFHPFILITCCPLIEQFKSPYLRATVAVVLALYLAYVVQNIVNGARRILHKS